MQAAVFLIAYLLGSVSSAVLVSRGLYGEDVRAFGSGNAGATNVTRVYGLRPGLCVLLCDMAKTALALCLGTALCGETGFALAGVGCLVGHCMPLFCGFRGGKGVSTLAAIALLCDRRVFFLAAAVFFSSLLISRKVSLSSLLAAAAVPLSAFALGLPRMRLALTVFGCLLVILRHRENIGRLRRGEENDFSIGNRT